MAESRFARSDAGLPPSWPPDVRSRLLSAMAEVAWERGFIDTRVEDVLERADISRRTFYAYFNNREDCFFAAYDVIRADALRLLAPAEPPEEPGQDSLTAALTQTLSHYAEYPAHAHVLLTEVLSAGPAGVERHDDTMHAIAERLDECAAWSPPRRAGLSREDLAQAVVGAIQRVVQTRLRAGHARDLPTLAPALSQLAASVAGGA